MTSPKVWSKGTCSNRERRIVRDTEGDRSRNRGQAQSGNCFCCGKTGQKNATDADKRRQSVIPAGGKIISIPCVAAQAHKDTNKLTDRYTRWDDDVTKSTDGEDEYELFAINSAEIGLKR